MSAGGDDRLAALVEDVWRRMNRDGGLNGLLAITSPEAEALLGSLPGYSRLLDVRSELSRLTVTPARGVLVFASLGWAFSSKSPLGAYEAALELVDTGATPEQAEQALVDGWCDNALCKSLSYQVRSLVPPEDELSPVCAARADLIRKAWEHHQAERYDASVPIALAQADGLMHDALGKTLFTNADDRASDVVDDQTLAGLDGSLSVARVWFSQDVRPSQVKGSGSRHGVVHGRELGYATRSNSTKAFVLLAAVVEFSAPVIGSAAENRRLQHDLDHAGSDEVDDDGRRLDRRGFPQACDALRRFSIAQAAQYPGTQHYVEPDRLRLPSAPDDHPRLHVSLTHDRSRWWAWARSEAGWVFGLAGGPQFEEWEYDGPEPPRAAPWDDPTGWIDDTEAPSPNWTYPRFG